MICYNWRYHSSFIGGRQLPYNKRQQVFQNGTMIIKNVERKEDATSNGAYTCVARNDEGYSARSDLQVSVMGKSHFSRLIYYNLHNNRYVKPLNEISRKINYYLYIRSKPIFGCNFNMLINNLYFSNHSDMIDRILILLYVRYIKFKASI